MTASDRAMCTEETDRNAKLQAENERLRDVDAAAERIFFSCILDEIAAAELDGKLAGRDAMEDAIALARLALGTDENQDGGDS